MLPSPSMAIMDPADIPSGRDHLDPTDRARLEHFERLVATGALAEAQDLAEELWVEAVDAHKGLFRGLANALTAACARSRGQLRGAREIAAATRTMLSPYPSRAVGLDLDRLLASLDAFVATGEGRVYPGAEG